MCGIIIFSIYYSEARTSYKQYLDKTYFQSTEFIDRYMNTLKQEIYNLIYAGENEYDAKTGDARIYYSRSNGVFSKLQDCNYVIIYKPRTKVYTNINRYSNMQEMKDYVNAQEGKKVKIVNGLIEADTKEIEQSWNNYYKNFFDGRYYTNGTNYGSIEFYNNYIVQSEIINTTDELEQRTDTQNEIYDIVDFTIKDFEIYITYKEEIKIGEEENFIIGMLEILQRNEDIIYVAVPISGILIVIIAVYLVVAIGHKKDKDEIELNDLDKIPIEIIITILIIILSIIIMIVTNSGYIISDYIKLFISEMITAYFVSYVLLAITTTTVIKRIKAKKFLENSITWKIIKIAKKGTKNIKEWSSTFTERLDISWRVILAFLIYILSMIIAIIIFGEEPGIRDNDRYCNYSICNP